MILALTVGITVKAPFVGSLLFPFGFASIVLFGMELVTGNLHCCRWPPGPKSSWGATFRNWIWVWIGNWIGTAVVAVIMAVSLTSGTMDGAADNVEHPSDSVAQTIIRLNKATSSSSTKIWVALASSWPFCVVCGQLARLLGVTMALVSKSVPGTAGLLASDHRICRWAWGTSW